MPLFHHPHLIDDRLELAQTSELPWLGSGLKVGFGFFETLLSRLGRIEAIDRHYQRLRNSCDSFNLPAPSYAVFQRALHEALESSNLATPLARLRYSVTSTTAHGSGALCVAEAEAFIPYTDQASVVLLPWASSSQSPMVGHKSLSYANPLWGFNHAKSLGFDEGLWLNEKGHISEACTSNVFWMKRGHLYTPAPTSGCLPGIARQCVLEVAQQLNMPIHEGHFHLSELLDAEEAFLTSSLRGIQSIQSLKTQEIEIKWSKFNATSAIKPTFDQFVESQSVHDTKIK